MKRLFEVACAVTAGLAFAFLLLPLVALFLRVSPGALVSALVSEPAREALLVSLETSAIAHVIILAAGTPVAYLLGTRDFRGRRALIAAVELPLVLPPAVAGIALLAAFGSRGLLGDELDLLGVSLPFTQAAVVLAIVFVASPFYIRQAVAAFGAVDRTLLDAAR
ncbi:MAG: molybdate ABC transporter permease subunit, partial [Actinomycetota bacterium]|nr:molybdate ABC transporter permease subunit [Actinomycetota bacterium]